MPKGIYKRNKPESIDTNDGSIKRAKAVLIQRAIECMQDGFGTIAPEDTDDSFWCLIKEHALQIVHLTEIE